jgi:hypothetical protein
LKKLFLLGIVMFLIVFIGCENQESNSTMGSEHEDTKQLTEEDVNRFINKNEIEVIKMIKTTNNYFYLFHRNGKQAVINVIKGNRSNEILMSNAVRDFSDELIMVGGVEDGSIGVWVEDSSVLNSASYFTATINNKYILLFKFLKGEKFYVFEDVKFHYNDHVILNFFDEDHRLIN